MREFKAGDYVTDDDGVRFRLDGHHPYHREVPIANAAYRQALEDVDQAAASLPNGELPYHGTRLEGGNVKWHSGDGVPRVGQLHETFTQALFAASEGGE